MSAARLILLASLSALVAPAAAGYSKWRHRWRNDAEVGYRPEFLVSRMDDSDLKTELEECNIDMTQHKFSIGHRGACLQYPEHTKESYEAAAKQGAGIIECDVSFLLYVLCSSLLLLKSSDVSRHLSEHGTSAA